MAQTLKTHQLNLNESQQQLKEIGQRVSPYTKNFNWEQEKDTVHVAFTDDIDKTNEIDVYFHPTDLKNKVYEIEFNVNKYSGKAFKTDTSHFFKIISTVVEVIEQFIQKYKPFELKIEPDELVGKEKQKYKIWMEYLKANLKDNDYILGKTPNGFIIQIRKNYVNNKINKK
jgi:hypothetical protein